MGGVKCRSRPAGRRSCLRKTNDLWIAAIVLEHDLALYSRDAHFQALPQLNLV